FSWWCGALDASLAGGAGYGNDWNERLELPPVDLGQVAVERVSWGVVKALYRDPPLERPRASGRGRATAPVLSFAYRHDSEPGYDFTWVEVESLGTWVKLNDGYDGQSGGWQNVGSGGFPIAGYGNPVHLRFRFDSDGAFSDEDGLYDSDSGAFSVDNIQVFDAITSEILFFDGCDGGAGLCTPLAPDAAGDYWRVADQPCQAYSDPHVWVVSWPDTDYVQPNLKNWLQTPVVHLSNPDAAVEGCTLYSVMHYYMPSHWGGYWAQEATVDGGLTWTRVGMWYGDQCSWGYGPCQPFLDAIPIVGPGLPYGEQVAVRWIIYTDPVGNYGNPECTYQSAGLAIDDAWIEVVWSYHYLASGKRPASGERLKAFYR
ncbi:MAG: hypothetical protein ABIG03_03615, partial [Candidatus Eisenbacteria bacterium]